MKTPEGFAAELQREKLLKTIDEIVSKYRVRLSVSFDYRFYVRWLPAGPPKLTKAEREPYKDSGGQIDGFPIGEMGAIQVVLEMATAGTLDRIRQCQNVKCRKWFFATTNKKVVCGDACRFQKYVEGKGKEEFKNERKEYMSTYRRNPKVKSRLKARRKKQPKKEK